MINKIEKIYNIVAASLYSIYVLIALILIIFVPKYNILFSGWWTLFIILPSLGSFLFQSNKLNSLYIVLIGIMSLLTAQGIINLNKCFTILFCLGIIFLGINIITSTIKIPEKKNSIIKFVPFYYAFLGSTEETIETTFKGGRTKVLIGSLSLDLKESTIEDNSTLKVFSLFGETQIILPDNIDLYTSNTNILGGTENLYKSKSKKKNKKLYIESTSILGSTKIK